MDTISNKNNEKKNISKLYIIKKLIIFMNINYIKSIKNTRVKSGLRPISYF